MNMTNTMLASADADVEAAPPPKPRSLGRVPQIPEVTTVLLVDDDVVDVMAIRRAFKTLRIGNPVVTAQNGIEALHMLRGNNGCAKLPAPYVVLLDLNMPQMGGAEFLTELRDDPDLCQTIVFVMTTSAVDVDRRHAYRKNIAGYVVKNRSDRSFIDAIALLQHYLCTVELPD
jgi:CheY-like chemotaxis protein